MTAIEEIEAARAEIGTLKAAKVESDDALAKAKEELTASAALITESEANVKALATERDQLAETVAKAATEHAELVAKFEASEAELAKAKGELRNPALAAAALIPSASVPAGAESGATKTKAQLLEEYAAIPSDTIEGAYARDAFRAEHKEELGLK